MKKALVLGAGLVAGPLVRYLLNVDGFTVTVASRTVEKAQALVSSAGNGIALSLNVRDEAALEALIADHDLSISLLPYVYHPTVARLCVKHHKQMVTTSYVKPEMQALDASAKEAGVILLSEVGVDPGIDHMSAMEVIHKIADRSGKLISFTSNTGGLPAPDANDNPFGYKFSWAPRGVVMAGKNPAKFLKNGEVIDVPGPELFSYHWPCEIKGFGELEVYPNRDSMPYIESYGIPTVTSMFRGTLRYPGWCETLKRIVDLGLLDEIERDDITGLTYGRLLARLIDSDGSDLRSDLAEFLGIAADSEPVARLEWLGLLCDDAIPAVDNTYLDVVASRMLSKMGYAPGERDMLVMQHEFVVEYPDRTEKITSTMVDYGIPNGDSSMSRLVGLPAAIAARMILQGEINVTGVHVPIIPEIYKPVLAELAAMGISFQETVETL